MRIRRKKNLEIRIEKVSENLIISDFDIMNVNDAVKDKKFLDYNRLFNNNNKVSLEIGCGKGLFAVEMAKRHPDTNFIAVELLSNIIVMAAELAKKEKLKNLYFFNCGADYLPRYIRPDSIKNIYLNFSPPFPGDRYKNRRLTKDKLVEDYYSFLEKDGCIYQKTDDKTFFDFSFEQLKKYKFEVFDISEKIRNNEIENVKTEYENKFISLGIPVYYLLAKKL